MLAAGVGLSVAGFCVPPVGEISSSVLWFFSQCLIYAGAALGIDVMIDNKLKIDIDTITPTNDTLNETQKRQ